MIGDARWQCKLYFFEEPMTYDKGSEQVISSTKFKTNSVFHRKLGHSSFTIVQTKFSFLFHNVDITKLHCNVCELKKNKRVILLSNIM